MKTQKFLKITFLAIAVILLIFAYPYCMLMKEEKRIDSEHIYNYFVWEIKVLSADRYEGQSLQIAEIRGRNLNNFTLPSERHFDNLSWEEQKPTAISNLGYSPASTEDLSNEVGFENETKISYPITINSLFEGPAFEIRPKPDAEEAVLNIRLKKRCDVNLAIVEKTNWRKRVQGIWALPYRYTREVLEIKKPNCYDPSDKTIILTHQQTS